MAAREGSSSEIGAAGLLIERWAFPALALLVATAYWPYWHDGAVSPKWMVLCAAPVMLLWVRVQMTAAHWWGLAFLIWSAACATWSVSSNDAERAIVHLLLLAAVFIIGAQVRDARWIYAAFITGISVSGLLAITETLGLMTVPAAIGPAGLMGNKNYLAEAALCAVIVCLVFRWWWASVLPMASLVLPVSRGAILALGVVGMAWLWKRNRAWAILLFVVCAASALIVSSAIGWRGNHSIQVRIDVWSVALDSLTWLGHGSGSFQAAYPLFANYIEVPIARPEHAHNEFINLAFETGIPGVILALGLCAALWRGAGMDGPESWIALAILATSLFSFPLHLPVTGFVAAFVAGRLGAHGHSVRAGVRDRGAQIFPRAPHAVAAGNPVGA